MDNLTSLKESGLNIFYVMLAASLSAGTPAFASESSEVWAYSAPPATETAVIAGPTHACVNSILTFRGNGNENNQHYVWVVDDASIIYGAGTNEIQLTFTTPGTKNLTLQFRNNQGDVSTVAQLTVEVASLPTFAPITTSAVCEGSVDGLLVPAITGTYMAGTGFWSLDGVELPAGYQWKYNNDHGKLLQYNVRTLGCGLVSSDGVLLTVNRIPTITSVSGIPESLSAGSILNATVTALGNGPAITGYEWWIGDTKIGTLDNLTYAVSPADNGKTVKVKVFNACGADSVTHTIKFTAGGTITTRVNDSVKSVSPVPEGFMIQPVTAETKRELPEKYWENSRYWFVTSPNMISYNDYIQGDTVYLERDAAGIWSVSSVSSPTSYTATVQKASSILALNLPIDAAMNQIANTTVVLDQGFIPMGNSIALRREGLKIFGLGALGNSIIQGQTNEPNYINAKKVVLENIVFDGINFARNTHFLRIQDEGANGSNPANPARRADFVILKNIAIRNVSIRGGGFLNMSPRGILNIDDNNAYYEDGATDNPGTAIYTPSYNITARYFINITIENSCVLGSGGYPLYINSSRYDYLENLRIDITNSTYPAWIMQARDNATEVSNSSGQVPTGITINGLTSANDGIFIHRYQSKDITLPNDYRFLRFRTTNGTPSTLASPSITAVTAYKALPAAASGYAYYDRNDGYWIVRDGASRTISQQLTDLRTIYTLTVTPGTKTSLPPLSIKLVKNGSGTVNGFTVPDFGKMPVHIVAVDAVDAPVDKAGTIIPYAGETIKIVLPAANAPYVNLSNIDFTEHVSYYIDSVSTKITNALPGNFHHCNFLKDLYEKDSLLLLNMTETLAFSHVSVCEPDVVDLKDLALVSGDTAGMTLKYYVDGVELTNTVISAPGTTSVSIVGAIAGGLADTTMVNVTIGATITPVITGPVLVYTGTTFNYRGDGENQAATDYYWSTNSGTVRNGQHTNEAGISWSAPGTDLVTLTYTTGGCRHTGVIEVKIIAKEDLTKAGFSINSPVQCFEDHVYRFTNQTVFTSPNSLVGYLWDFGDGSTGTQANPTHTYQQGGVYDVTLIAYGTIVNDTIRKSVRLLAPFVERPADQVVCVSNYTEEVVFEGTADMYHWESGRQTGLSDGRDPVRISSFITKNESNHPVTDTITVTPVMSSGSLECRGESVRFYITVNPAVVPTISGPVSVCYDTEETYTTKSGMRNYDWVTDGGRLVAGGGPDDDYATIRWNDSSNGSVSVRYSGDNICSPSQTATLSVTVDPEVIIVSQPVESVSICSGEALDLEVIASGADLAYQWYLNGKAIAGATAPAYRVPDSKVSDSGDYYVVVTSACYTVQSATSGVSVGIPDIVVQKWENVLAVVCVPSENGGYEFASFQWYKNGDLMQGETESYLHVSGVIDYAAVYTVRLTTVAGNVFYTCGRTFMAKNRILVSAYPNPVRKGRTLNMEINGVNENTAVDWLLIDNKGVILQKQSLNGSQATITVPDVSGIYILRVHIATPEPESNYFKIIVN